MRIIYILAALCAVLFVINFLTLICVTYTKQSERIIFGFKLASALTATFAVSFAFIATVLVVLG